MKIIFYLSLFFALNVFALDTVPSKASQLQVNQGINDQNYVTSKGLQNKTNAQIFQSFTNITRNIITVTNAGGVSSIDGTNGVYGFAGLFDTGILYYTNSSVINGNVIMLSNGPVSQLQLTNTVANLFLYHKSAVAGGFINGNAWTADAGASPGPNARFNTIVVSTQHSNGALTFAYPILYPGQNTNQIELSLSGNDLTGVAGIMPFRTLEYPLRFCTNNPTYIVVNPGVYSNYNLIATNPMGSFTTIIGSGRGVSFLGDPATINENYVSLQLADTNVLINLSIPGKIHNYSGRDSTDLTIVNCDIGTTNAIDVFFTLGGSTIQFKNLKAYNSSFTSGWDINFGVGTGEYHNCIGYVLWCNTNAGDQSFFTGTHCFQPGVLGDQTMPYRISIDGGYYEIANGIDSTTAGTSNAIVQCIGTNCHVLISGMPTFKHSASNNIPHYAIYNPGMSLDIHGTYIDNGTFGTNTPCIAVVNGTNFSYYGLITTTTPTIGQLQGAAGSVDWTSNGVRFITTSVNGTSVTTTKLAP